MTAELEHAETLDGINVTPMTAQEARECVTAIKQNIDSTRLMLLDLHRRRGWEALGYASWEQCAIAEFGQSRAYVFRLLAAAQVEDNLSQSTIVDLGEVPTSQLATLAKLPPEQQSAGLQKAEGFAAAEGKKRTAAHVAKAVREIKEPSQSTTVAFADDAGSVEDTGNGAIADDVESTLPEILADTRLKEDKDEQYTPSSIIDAVLECFGGRISLDPCSNSHTSPNVPAEKHFTKEDDGLKENWEAENLYVNPPYSNPMPWVEKTIEAVISDKACQAIILTPGDTSTKWFNLIWEHASAVCFVGSRLKFVNPANKNGARFNSAVSYFGSEVETFYKCFKRVGKCVRGLDEFFELSAILSKTSGECQRLRKEMLRLQQEVEFLKQQQGK